VAEIADTTIVALQPGSGDSVQVLKAGILEIADIFVVNKSDHPMALQLQREIRSMMEMLVYGEWTPLLVPTQAIAGTGIDALWDAILAHDAWLRESGELPLKRRAAFAHRVETLALGTLQGRVEAAVSTLEPDTDPYAAAAMVLEGFGVGGGANALGNVRAPRRVRATVKGL
jgi:LAO/AO transport system kinase